MENSGTLGLEIRGEKQLRQKDNMDKFKLIN